MFSVLRLLFVFFFFVVLFFTCVVFTFLCMFKDFIDSISKNFMAGDVSHSFFLPFFLSSFLLLFLYSFLPFSLYSHPCDNCYRQNSHFFHLNILNQDFSKKKKKDINLKKKNELRTPREKMSIFFLSLSVFTVRDKFKKIF